MDVGDELDLRIDDVAHGGVFVARHGAGEGERGRVVFVPDTLPGEEVRVRLVDTSKKAFWRAEVVEVARASSDRRPHVWAQADLATPPANRPGGADFGHIALETQRALKKRVVEDALRRVGGAEREVTMAPAGTSTRGAETPDATRWRTRVSLHVDARGAVGPYAVRSHRVVQVTELPLATAEIEEALGSLGRPAPGRVDLVQPSDGRVRVIPRPERTRRGPAIAADPSAHEVIIEHVGERAFRVDAGGFWQVHRLAAETLTDVVTTALSRSGAFDPGALHLDLYGGVGLFAAALGDLGGPRTRTISVESDRRATDHAVRNLTAWPAMRAETGRVDRWLPRLAQGLGRADAEALARGTILLDPPRAGAGRDVVDAVAALTPAAVVYVACDPVALARDLRTFRDHGYDTAVVEAIDLFPHSHHVEAVAVLTGEGRRG
ncbi:tRNA/tmRNA/rRNA uracil-C5-methylase (TrmA/RlmC/RlmD family) [Microbacterium sp. AK009]|uniref:class I SAM-dependent RNA methyltransferase n=1 Tax=Microbacterium sp. AK009 TaxID=2723068 RepID=UPI0015CD65C9|nr:TRAM domain-containing protein [Microbacterium sp. AK009]NYF15824.1 tRNA/tmRNA/rRNA uracil-C5-methylase (TrmA/RlmC/RlmD family) [Microbacterium sp. AK009]